MTHRPESTPTDETLARLLQVERALELRVQEAEKAAEAQIAAAREAARRADSDRGADVEAAARSEEEADLEHQAEQLRRIAADGNARVGRLSAVPESVVDRLARRAVALLLQREGAGRP